MDDLRLFQDLHGTANDWWRWPEGRREELKGNRKVVILFSTSDDLTPYNGFRETSAFSVFNASTCCNIDGNEARDFMYALMGFMTNDITT